MTVAPASPAASQQAAVDAALLILERMGLSPDDLAAAPRRRLPVPTFADYVPVVSAAVTDGTRRAYGTYWNRITEQWGTRRLDEPTPSEVRQLMKLVKANAVQRRNGRGGRSAQYGSRISLADQGDRGVAAESCAFVEPSGACLVPAGPRVPVLDVAWRP